MDLRIGFSLFSASLPTAPFSSLLCALGSCSHGQRHPGSLVLSFWLDLASGEYRQEIGGQEERERSGCSLQPCFGAVSLEINVPSLQGYGSSFVSPPLVKL